MAFNTSPRRCSFYPTAVPSLLNPAIPSLKCSSRCTVAEGRATTLLPALRPGVLGARTPRCPSTRCKRRAQPPPAAAPPSKAPPDSSTLSLERVMSQRLSRDVLDSGFALAAPELGRLLQAGPFVYSTGLVTSAIELAGCLHSDIVRGVSSDPASLAARRAEYGSNTLPEQSETGFLAYLSEALEDFTVRTLLVAGLISIAIDIAFDTGQENGWIEGAAILSAVAVVLLVTAVNNYQKERQFRELNALQKDTPVRVIRDGKESDVSSYDVVVGDLLVLDTGDILPADGVLVSGHSVRVDESNLTGEADDIEKDPFLQPVLFSGSKVVEGVGRVLVAAVGTNSQQGQIMSLAGGGGANEGDELDSMGLREETNLQRQLGELATLIGQFGLVAGVVVTLTTATQFSYDTFVLGGSAWSWAYLTQYLHCVILGITILVVAIPEGLPLATTIGLAYSVKRMLADNNLVRHLSAAETMGCATTICCDKTGTLTQNNMAVVRAYVAGAELPQAAEVRASLRAAMLANGAGGDAAPAANGNGNGNGAAIKVDRSNSTAAEVAAALLRGGNDTCSLEPAVIDTGGLDPRNQQLLCDAIAVNTTASIVWDAEEGDWIKRGSRTECALLELAEALGGRCGALREEWVVAQLYPFSSERKRMSTLAYQTGHSLDGMVCAKLFTKGAAEVVLGLCDNALQPDGSVGPLAEADKEALLESYGRDGRRMLCIAYRDVLLPAWDADAPQHELPPGSAEQHLTLLAMCGIEDPLREEVSGAICDLQRAGIVVRMLTGDNAITAFSIARQCGIVPLDAPLPLQCNNQRQPGWKERLIQSMASQGSLDDEATGSASGNVVAPRAASLDSSEVLVMESADFRSLVLRPDGTINQPLFDKVWPKLRVLARCTPLDKYTIVKACKANPDEVVAMTGDGTNDAPALRLANVGFAMASGTAIAKEASDILLLEDNLGSIVQAVKWGRNVYAGATKFLQFQLTINVGAVVTATLGAFVLKDSPLAAIQMLWINLIMDSLASLSLATETPSDEVLDQPPYATEGSLMTPTVVKNIVGQTAYQLSVMYWLVFVSPAVLGYPDGVGVLGPSVHYTMVFNAFVCMQLFNQVNARKLRDDSNILDGIATDNLFLSILAVEAAIQAVLVQYGGQAFSCAPLNAEQWAVCVGLGAGGLLVRQALRWVRVEAPPSGKAAG